MLVVEQVTKQYAAHKALDNVSMTVPEGSIFGLLGPNGAGKTSLIRIINRITGPDEGRILFNGHALNATHVDEIGYLPEERGLYKKMQVGEQVLYLAQLKGMSRGEALKKLKMWFEKLEIQAWWNKKIEELSKGMQQKVQFITTVIHEPRFLILDEPFTGFDPINAEIIKNELLELHRKGTTIMLSTHRMESVEQLCTHIALINKSQKMLDGEVGEIRKNFRSNIFEIEYTNGNPVLFSTALWTGYELVDSKKKGNIDVAQIRLLHGNTSNQLLHTLISNKIEILSFRELVPSMNDIFISTVKSSGNVSPNTDY